MRHKFVILFAGGFLLLAGCVTSLHPLYTGADVVFAPELVGTWAESNAKDVWTFEKDGDKPAYRVTYTDDSGKKGVFTAHLVKLEGLQFLDFFPDDAATDSWPENDFYKMHLFRVHTFVRVFQVIPQLEMAAMHVEWLDKLLKDNPTAIAHAREDDRLLLTAPTKDLQQFVFKQMRADGAWGDRSKLFRRDPKR